MDKGTRLLLEQFEREVPFHALADRQERPLWHYTTASGLHGILKDSAIRAAHYLHLNDSEELLVGERIVSDVFRKLTTSPDIPRSGQALSEVMLEAWEEYRPSHFLDLYIAAFSEERDLLTQWRAYGDSGNGYVLGFSALPNPTEEEPEARLGCVLVRALYREGDVERLCTEQFTRILQGVDVYVQKAMHAGNAVAFEKHVTSLLLRQAAVIVPRVKHSAFEDEREWRLVAIANGASEVDLVKHQPGTRGIKPYVDIPLCKSAERIRLAGIGVGPLQDERSGLHGVRSYLDSLGYEKDISVEHSKLPFRG